MEAVDPFETEYIRLVDSYCLSTQEQAELLQAIFRRMEEASGNAAATAAPSSKHRD